MCKISSFDDVEVLNLHNWLNTNVILFVIKIKVTGIRKLNVEVYTAL